MATTPADTPAATVPHTSTATGTTAGSPPPVPVAGHPRLWVRAADLPRLRAWATAGNPLYQDGVAALAADAKNDMDAGRVPGHDNGGVTSVDYPTEMYAELFAFLSLVDPDPSAQTDYARRARTLLMYVIAHAAAGAAPGQPFRDPDFAVNDRSRWHGEAFGLTVDWIYPVLTAADKATIRRVFLRWIDDDLNATVTGHDHPQPPGVTNDPALTADRTQVRWAGNNYWTAHMRNIGLMAMALDSVDDPGNELHNALDSATGAWLYVVADLMRTNSRGGLFPEGFEYSPQTVGYILQFLLALHTAGLDDPAQRGPQVVLAGNPFWDDFVSAYLESLSPRPVDNADLGPVYQPAWYGDGQNYWAPDFIQAFGPLGLYDAATGNTTRLAALRWIETNLAPGGSGGLAARAHDDNFFQNAILYFLLFDPHAATPPDPRPAQPLAWYAPGLGRILARTDWGPDAAWFTYKLSWNMMDHQNGDGNQFEFYRRGEWLTKERTGYDLDYGSSDNHNTLALQNNAPADNDPGSYRNIQWQRGSQWAYVADGDPHLLAHSERADFVYALGDATPLYNSTSENAADIVEASRAIVWLPPDYIVVYDRAASRTAGRFKRFWLNLPAPAKVVGNRTTMTTAAGQQLFLTTLLPENATIAVEADPVPPLAGDVANGEPMQWRVRVEAPGGPVQTRFLHVLQGADPGAPAAPVTRIGSTAGTPFAGALVASRAVLFPVDGKSPFSSLTYRVPAGPITHVITGLAPGAGYSVTSQPVGGEVEIAVQQGGNQRADSGGVLRFSSPVAP